MATGPPTRGSFVRFAAIEPLAAAMSEVHRSECLSWWWEVSKGGAPNYTFVSKLRKDLLPAAALYRGTHARLRQLGRDYLAGGG